MSSASVLSIMQSSLSHFVATRLEDIQRFHEEVMELDTRVREDEVSLETDSSRQSLVVKQMNSTGIDALYWIPFAYFDDVEGYIAVSLEVPSTSSH